MGDVTQTTFGLVIRSTSGTTVSGTPDELRSGARNPYTSWPCSVLARLGVIVTAEFDSTGDLVGLEGEQGYELPEDLPGDELNAWTSECLVRAGYPNHPAIR